MSQWPETEALPAPGAPLLDDVLEALVARAIAEGSREISRAATNSGVLRLNISLSVRHGKPQGSSRSLSFELKQGQ